MRKLIAGIALALASTLAPAAVLADECPSADAFEARYGYTAQEYVNRVATSTLTLAAERASRAAVASGELSISRWSPEYGTRADGTPVNQYGDLYRQARLVEFRDGKIDFDAARSYLGNQANVLIDCGFVSGDAVRAAIADVKAVELD